MIVEEASFDFILGASGSIMLVMLARPREPKSPFLVYDTWRKLALFRDNSEIVELAKVPWAVRRALRHTPDLDVTEMTLSGRTIRQYRARIVLDSHLKAKLRRERRAPIGA